MTEVIKVEVTISFPRPVCSIRFHLVLQIFLLLISFSPVGWRHTTS